ncbi:hypothetical protein GOBAR_DD30627 [Gossypium barbadense]|nr:hypothetical protein GOBAR_DD30627 [Gossypium barbadense]
MQSDSRIFSLSLSSSNHLTNQMAMQEGNPAGTPSAQVVGNAFVEQYYHILHQSPNLVHRFYQDSSCLSRPDMYGNMTTVTTMQPTHENLVEDPLTYPEDEDVNNGAEVFDPSDKEEGSVIEDEVVEPQNITSPNETVVVVDSPPVVLEDAPKKSYASIVKVMKTNTASAPVYVPINNVRVAPKEPHSIVSAKPAPATEVALPNSDNTPESSNDNEEGNCQLHLCTLAYAAIFAFGQAINEKVLSLNYEDYTAEIKTADAQDSFEKGVIVLVTGCLTGKDNVRRKFTQTFFLAPQDKGYFVLNDIFRYVEEKELQNTVPDNGIYEQASTSALTPEPEGHSIYVRNLPYTATPAQLELAFKKFGPIKRNGIQVRSNKQGFTFGFVEFENASSVQSALEASPITIGDRQAAVEEKRTNTRELNPCVGINTFHKKNG